MRPSLLRLSLMATLVSVAVSSYAQDQSEDEFAPKLPERSIYVAMLEANKPSGWVQFRNFAGGQYLYFTMLQVMRCRLSEVRYSINSTALDQRFPLGPCNPQQPFNVPDDPDNRYVYLKLKPGEAETVTVQAVWDDGAGSEIITYRPCDNVGESACARIKAIDRPEVKPGAPKPASQSR
ncbi:hypothetical protein M2360_004715 [Rhizobium sp. SG_E_25_P2]|uniref:hypothetical protein n=1 Tax=Rhizobium sp. SG_E_25_P2 TaxID=2879942 RepID=UPI0024751303|nr:hypothetical protein [Rhizobium sp. SG_E_25_P2]MDH6269287.1 hypothetical protein [Rhizobium sp. SG_E_25_P2]